MGLKRKLEGKQQKKRDVTRRLKKQRTLLSDARLSLGESILRCNDLIVENEDLKGVEVEADSGIQIREGGKGNPMTREFENLPRSCMATGMSAAACLQSLRISAEFFLGEEAVGKWKWPSETWFQRQREAVGNTSWLLVMVEVAGAERILQHGCDETGISEVGTFSQWVLLRDTDGKVKVRVLECAGLMAGSTAEDITAHVKVTWSRGRDAVALLRERLGERADELVPIRMGGVRLLRLECLMSDGCNTAKAVMRLLGEAKNEDGKDFYGDEAWGEHGP